MGVVVVPEELSRRVDRLADVVEALRTAVNRRTRWLWGTIAVAVAVVAVPLTIDRIDVNHARAEARHSDEQVRAVLAVDCAFYGDIAKAPLPRNASELGKRIVRDAAASYDKRGCERLYGPLPGPNTGLPTPSPPQPSD